MGHTIGRITTRHVSMNGVACYRLEMRLGGLLLRDPLQTGSIASYGRSSINEMPVGLLGQRGL